MRPSEPCSPRSPGSLPYPTDRARPAVLLRRRGAQSVSLTRSASPDGLYRAFFYGLSGGLVRPLATLNAGLNPSSAGDDLSRSWPTLHVISELEVDGVFAAALVQPHSTPSAEYSVTDASSGRTASVSSCPRTPGHSPDLARTDESACRLWRPCLAATPGAAQPHGRLPATVLGLAGR